MAFSNKRGRPRVERPSTDFGTPELSLKKALDMTVEPLDLCLQRGIITQGHHRAGLHLRWLYTIRYGAPVLTTQYEAISSQRPITVHDEAWRSFREKEYHEAVTLLRHAHCYESIMRTCIYHDIPSFLNQKKLRKAWNKTLLIKQLEREKLLFSHGLDLLQTHWHFPNS